MPGVEARLAEQRRLLVAGDAADRDARRARRERVDGRRRSGRSTGAPRAARRSGTPKQVAQLVGPRAACGCRRASCGWRSTASVACTVAAGEVPEQPGVDGAEREVGVDRRRRPRCSSHSSFGAGEVRVEHQAGACRGRAARCPASRSSSQRAAVRRSCQTIARCRGSPVRRSHTTTVSRWLVMPIAATGSLELARPRSASVACDAVPDLVGVVLDPPGLREVLRELAVARHVVVAAVGEDGPAAHAGGAGVDGDHTTATSSAIGVTVVSAASSWSIGWAVATARCWCASSARGSSRRRRAGGAAAAGATAAAWRFGRALRGSTGAGSRTSTARRRSRRRRTCRCTRPM